jgi:ubiquinone/menaquinone biosynthesis C-methylase UbiE
MAQNQFDQERAHFFDNLAEKWDETGSAPSGDSIENFLRKVMVVSGEIVLDVGTGTGFLVPYIMQYGPKEIVAVDLSEKMLQRLATKYQNSYGAKLKVSCQDVHCLTFAHDTIDVAICNSVFPHFHDKPKVLSEVYRVLKSGGRMAIHHFAGREKINSFHSTSANPFIREDFLEDGVALAVLAKEVGFTVTEMIDNDEEYFLLAIKKS